MYSVSLCDDYWLIIAAGLNIWLMLGYAEQWKMGAFIHVKLCADSLVLIGSDHCKLMQDLAA